jgi:hypothetical protein
VNEHFTKIPESDWYVVPKDTNLNEGSHPWTNLNTGTNLTLLDAILK